MCKWFWCPLVFQVYQGLTFTKGLHLLQKHIFISGIKLISYLLFIEPQHTSGKFINWLPWNMTQVYVFSVFVLTTCRHIWILRFIHYSSTKHTCVNRFLFNKEFSLAKWLVTVLCWLLCFCALGKWVSLFILVKGFFFQRDSKDEAAQKDKQKEGVIANTVFALIPCWYNVYERHTGFN